MMPLFYVFLYTIIGTIINAIVIVNECDNINENDTDNEEIVLNRWTFHQLLTVIFWPFVVLTMMFKIVANNFKK